MVSGMSGADLKLNVAGVILDCLVESAAATGLVAGLPSEMLQAALFDALFREHRAWTLELALSMAEDEVLELQRLLTAAGAALEDPPRRIDDAKNA